MTRFLNAKLIDKQLRGVLNIIFRREISFNHHEQTTTAKLSNVRVGG